MDTVAAIRGVTLHGIRATYITRAIDVEIPNRVRMRPRGSGKRSESRCPLERRVQSQRHSGPEQLNLPVEP
jgi:hypothetical protein